MPTIDDLRAAASANDPIGYYTHLINMGDSYGNIALSVVSASGEAGAIARSFANSVGQSRGVSLSGADWYDLSLDLMRRDLDAREKKLLSDGSVTGLTGEQIRAYHILAFNAEGLPPEAWTAEIPFKLAAIPKRRGSRSSVPAPGGWYPPG